MISRHRVKERVENIEKENLRGDPEKSEQAGKSPRKAKGEICRNKKIEN